MRSPRQVRLCALPVLALLVAGGCGTRVNGSAAPTAGYSGPVASSAPGPGPAVAEAASAGNAGGAAGGAVGTSGSGSPPAQVNRAGGAVSVAGSAGSSTLSTTPGGSGRRSTVAAGDQGATSAPASSASPHGTGKVPAPALPPGPDNGSAKKSPLVVASIGNLSGPPSGTVVPIVKGAQVWVKFINDRGGLNGHEVRMLIYDDGSDVARHRAQAQEAVERQGAVAFLAETAPLTAQGTFDYLKQHRIPVIGTDTGVPWSVEHPMYFPQATSGIELFYLIELAASQLMVPAGKTKVGGFGCVESPICDRAQQRWAERASSLGLQMVYQGHGSVAQPDFTAECLGARNAGVEVMMLIHDANTIRRFAASCARQGFNPTFFAAAGQSRDDFKDEAALQGMYAATNTYPYTKVDTPAMQEYVTALARYGKDLTGIAPQTGWVAGKLLERAARALPEPPTNEAILAGLYSIRNEDLGGLTSSITFTRDQPHAPVVTCWWSLKVEEKHWVSPDGYQRHCL